jgi:hypothetical protein
MVNLQEAFPPTLNVALCNTHIRYPMIVEVLSNLEYSKHTLQYNDTVQQLEELLETLHDLLIASNLGSHPPHLRRTMSFGSTHTIKQSLRHAGVVDAAAVPGRPCKCHQLLVAFKTRAHACNLLNLHQFFPCLRVSRWSTTECKYVGTASSHCAMQGRLFWLPNFCKDANMQPTNHQFIVPRGLHPTLKLGMVITRGLMFLWRFKCDLVEFGTLVTDVLDDLEPCSLWTWCCGAVWQVILPYQDLRRSCRVPLWQPL